MVTFLSSDKKHASNIPYIALKLYNNIVSPNWVELDQCPKRGMMEAYSMLSKKVSTTLTSLPISSCWNAFNNIPSMAWVFHNKSFIPSTISLLSSPTRE